MEPITTIVTALALGAATGSQSMAEKAVKDAYKALKAIIQRCYQTINIQSLEEKPKSKARQDVLIEDLTDLEADKNQEILEKTKILIERIQDLSEAEVLVAGVKLEDIKGLNLNIEDIVSSGTGVVVKRAELKRDINIKGIRAGKNDLVEEKNLNLGIEDSSVGEDLIISENVIKNSIKPGLFLNLIILIVLGVIILTWNYPSLKLIKSFINQEIINKDINIEDQDLIELGVLIRNLVSVKAASWNTLRSASSPIRWTTEHRQESPDPFNNEYGFYLWSGNVFLRMNGFLDLNGTGHQPSIWSIEVYGTRTFVTDIFLRRQESIKTNIEDFEKQIFKSISDNNQLIITNKLEGKYGGYDGRKVSFLVKFSDRDVPASIFYSCGAGGDCWATLGFETTPSLKKQKWL